VAAEAVGAVEPWKGRMSPVVQADGVTFIRDDWKAPLWTVHAALEFLREARAQRKIVVLGTLSDYQGDSGRRYAIVTRQALEVADYVFVVGRWAPWSLKAKRHPDDDAIRAFGSLRELSDHFKQFLRPGDLVLLKGSNRADHLVRLVLARTGGVECWRVECDKRIFCDKCALLHVPEPPARSRGRVLRVRSVPAGDVASGDSGGGPHPCQLVLGLGNYDPRYADTRHNVGHRVVDLLARLLGSQWMPEDDDALVARADWQGQRVYLAKLARG
jgi:UDP-N-acetylmuramoyl-tripeptide--D-alanyl-D-alanine ligase